MYSRALYGLTCLAALISTGLSVPAASSHANNNKNSLTNTLNDLHTRDDLDVPSIEDIKDELKDAKDEYLFYAGPGSYAKKALQWSKKNGGKYKPLGRLWKDRSYPNDYQKTNKQYLLFFDRASAAMAEKAEGDVHVLLPTDTKSLYWKDTTVWSEKEWPNLPDDVTVIRVNPENDDEEIIQGEKGEWEFSFYQNDRCSGQTSGYNGKGSSDGCQKGLLNGSVNAYIPARMAANCKAIYYSDDDCDDEIAINKPMAKQTCTPVDEGIRSWEVKCDW